MNGVIGAALAVVKEQRVQELIKIGHQWRTETGASVEEIERLARKLADEEFALIEPLKGPR